MVLRRFVILLVTIPFLPAGVGAGQIYRYDYQKIIPVQSGLQVSLTNPKGSVTVTTNTDNRLVIDGVKNIYAETREEAEFVADHVQVEVIDSDGHFSIEPRFLRIQDRSPTFWQKLLGQSGDESSHGSVDFTLSVPADCSVEIENPLGEIAVTGLRGAIQISGDAGKTEIRDILGNVSVVTSSGAVGVANIEGRVYIKANGSDIRFSSLNGDLEIRNGNGKAVGEYLIGDLVLTQQGGEVDVRHIEGNIRIKVTSAPVRVVQDFGALDVSAESGDIDIATELNSSRDYFVETVSGSIRFMVPEASGGEVRLEAGSCEIDAQIPIAIDSFSRTRISGRFGNGGPKISLVTASGNITLGELNRRTLKAK